MSDKRDVRCKSRVKVASVSTTLGWPRPPTVPVVSQCVLNAGHAGPHRPAKSSGVVQDVPHRQAGGPELGRQHLVEAGAGGSAAAEQFGERLAAAIIADLVAEAPQPSATVTLRRAVPHVD